MTPNKSFASSSAIAATEVPSPEFASIGNRLESLSARLEQLNDEMLRFRGNVFGEGEAAEKDAPRPTAAGLLGSIYGQLDRVGDLLDRADRQFSSIRRLG